MEIKHKEHLFFLIKLFCAFYKTVMIQGNVIGCFCSFACLFIQMLHSASWFWLNIFRITRIGPREITDITFQICDHAMYRMQNVFFNAVTMPTQTLSPTQSSSGEEPWRALFAGKRLGALSHRVEGEAGMACSRASARWAAARKRKQATLWMRGSFRNDALIGRMRWEGKWARHFMCVLILRMHRHILASHKFYFVKKFWYCNRNQIFLKIDFYLLINNNFSTKYKWCTCLCTLLCKCPIVHSKLRHKYIYSIDEKTDSGGNI